MTFSLDGLVAALLGPLGLLIALLFIIWSGWRKYWVFGYYYNDMQAAWQLRYDEMKAEYAQRIKAMENRLDRAGSVAAGSTGLARRATDLAERKQQQET